MEKINCDGCTECCRWVTFVLQLGPERDNYIGFYEARGCKIRKLSRDKFSITVPSICPHMTVGGCREYKERPLLCRTYDCRNDPNIEGRNKNG